jgi:hypothetical protein
MVSERANEAIELLHVELVSLAREYSNILIIRSQAL